MERGELIASRLNSLGGELDGRATLVAVTKYSPLSDVKLALSAGHFDFGESRVQDLKEKALELEEVNLRWHFIGHLQRNKVKALLKVPNLYAIHSVDSPRLLSELINLQELFNGDQLKVFFQVNCTGEGSKGGVSPGDSLDEMVEQLINDGISKLSLAGLMTMGRLETDDFAGDAKRTFAKLRQERDRIRDKFQLNNLGLSMGMSSDYHIALDEGSSFVRIGGHIFKS